MSEEKLSDRQGIRLLILFIFGSSLIMGTGGAAKNDAWISAIIAVIAAIPVLLMYSRILACFPDKDFFEILEVVFGKVFGRVMALPFIWFAFHLGALVLRNFGEFIITLGLPETPQVVPIFIFAAVCIYGVKMGITTLGNCSGLFLYTVTLLIIVFTLLSIPNTQIENLKPIMYNGIKPVIKGAFSAFTFPYAETIVFAMVFKTINSGKSIYKVFMYGLLVAGIFVVGVNIRNIMILGAASMDYVYFPSYAAISRINIGDFLQRLEIAVSVIFLLSGFIKISLCLLAASKGLSRVLGLKDYKNVVIPIGMLMMNLSIIVYESIMEMFEWAFDVWPYYAVIFQVILPLIVLICIEVKIRIGDNSESSA